MIEFSEAVATAVIQRDASVQRFERFCCDLVSAGLEGDTPVLPTSASWDMGRDGRGRGPSGTIFCCCSLSDDVDPKAEADASRLASNTSRIDRLYFCSSQALSEKQCDALEARLLKHVPSSTAVTILGSLQLSSVVRGHTDVLERHYQAEVADIIALLQSDQSDSDPADVGLRLALATVGHDDSEQIRAALYTSALRQALSDGASRTVGDCCRDVTQHFRLASSLPPDPVKNYLKLLEDKGEVDSADGRYHLTAVGVEALRQQEAVAAGALLDGRRLVRDHVERELGSTLSGDQFERLWKLLQEKLTHLFYERGLQVVQSLTVLLGEEVAGEASAADLDQLARDVADTASGATGDPAQRAEIRTAVLDLLTHPQGDALKWLLRLCVAYVSICTLGIESRSGGALARLVSRVSLILDTDVVLALLNEGEAYHESARAVVKRWRALGGELLLANPVLREVAYHAWIAVSDYEQIEGWLPGSESDRDRLIENSFVRGFATLLAARQARKRQWATYIGQYRGLTEYEGARVAETLKADYGIALLPPRAGQDASLEKEVGKCLRQLAEGSPSGRRLKIARDKASRDAELYAAMVSHRRAARDRDPGSGCLLVTSARRLSEVEGKFTQPGDPHVVIPLAGVIQLLALVPNARLSLGSMRAILFDHPRARFTDELERVVLRVIRDSREFDLPWARRTTLMRELRNRIVTDARRRGEHTRYERDRVRAAQRATQPKKFRDTAQLLRESLDALAIDSRLEVENTVLRRELERVRGELERMQSEAKRGKH